MAETEAATADREWAYLQDRRTKLKVRALSNRLYQLERQRIMERREGLVKVASLAAGSVAVANVANAQIIQAAVAAIFLCTLASLIFGWGNKARDASKRAVEWTALDQAIDAAGERTFKEGDLDEWAARCHAIELGEPAQNAILFEQSYQRACEALGVKPTSGGPSSSVPRLFRLIP